MKVSGSGERLAGPTSTTLVSIAAAGLLVALKLGVGLATHSLGLVSAGIESSGDVIAAVLTFFAVRLGGRPADRGHPYGHRRAENLGALGEAAILLGGALLVTVEAVKHLAAGAHAPEIRWYQFAVIGIALVARPQPQLDLAARRRAATAARRCAPTRSISARTCSARSPCWGACWPPTPGPGRVTRWPRSPSLRSS